MSIPVLSLVLAAALAFTHQDAQRAYSTAARLVIDCTPREAGTAGGRAAANFIVDEVGKSGLDAVRDAFAADTPKGRRTLNNVYCSFCPDETKPWIVLVSHYDTKPDVPCPGANDGASTTALLIVLADAFKRWKEPTCNALLVWTDGEECFREYGKGDGFWGSKRAAEHVRSQKGMNVKAVICLDMLGDADLRIMIPSNGTDSLALLAVEAAERIGRPGLVFRMAECVRDDHVAFLDAGYPSIDLIDFEYGPGNSYWHTSADTIEHISHASLLKSGMLVVEMVKSMFQEQPR